MSLKAQVGGSFQRELPDAGMMRARCVAVLDLGTHIDKKFPVDDKGRPNRRHLIQIQFELDQLMEYEGEKKPMMATLRLALSMNKKASLRKHLESWRGKPFDEEELKKSGGFDISTILGKPALLNIQHSSDGQYANITSINPPMKGSEAAPQFYPSRFFDLSNPSADVLATLSANTRQFIAESEEVKSGQVVLPRLSPAAQEAPKGEAGF